MSETLDIKKWRKYLAEQIAKPNHSRDYLTIAANCLKKLCQKLELKMVSVKVTARLDEYGNYLFDTRVDHEQGELKRAKKKKSTHLDGNPYND